MKFCIVGPTYPYRGGISHYTTLLTEHLRNAGHRTKLYSFSRQYPRFLFPGTTDKDPSRLPLRTDCEYILDPINPLSWWELVKRVEVDTPDVLILQWWVPYWMPSLTSVSRCIKTRAHVPILYICHNVLPHDGGGLLDRLLARTTLRPGDAFIVHSERDERRLYTLLPDAHVIRSHLPTYAEVAERREARGVVSLRQQLGLAEGQPVALFFGFVRPYKGLTYLLDALPAVLDHIDLHLLVVGEFWQSSEPYRRRVEAHGVERAVTFVDRYIPNEELPLYFESADVVVLPYVTATQSAVVQLAFGFEKPVITTAVGGLTEVVEDGVNGFVVPPEQSGALADAILQYFSGDWQQRLSANVRDTTEERFSWSRTVTLIETLGATLAS